MTNLARVAKAFIFYRNQATGDDQVLLMVRSQTDDRSPGMIDIPGGGVGEEESLEQALVREIGEESGLMVDPQALKEITDSGAVSNETKVEKHVFVTRVHDPAVVISVEHESAAWYPLEEAARLFPHPFYGKVLQYIIDHKLHENL